MKTSFKSVFAVCIVTAGIVGVFFYTTSDVAYSSSSGWRGLNSQTVSLLSAPLSPQSNYSIGGGEIDIVDSSALHTDNNPSATDANKLKSESDQISTYVVREGDSLSQIADMFGVTTNTIIWSNDIDHGSLIKPGQELIILPISGVRYTVESGDTLKKIAREYDGNVEEIKEYNDLSSDSLSVGQEVIIPNGEINSPSPYTKTKYAAGGASGGNTGHDGYYIKPVSGVDEPSQGLHGYNAIDFATSYGVPIKAAASGEVIISRDSGAWNGGYGNYVVIKHNNGTQTLYAHNSRNTVGVGERVVQGEVIGYLGSTGRSTGPHVHFEVRGRRNPFAR